MEAIKYLTFLILMLVSFTIFSGESSSAPAANSQASFVNTLGPRHRHVWVRGHYKVNRHGRVVWVPGHWRRVRC